MARQQGGDLFIIDNSDPELKVNAYLAEWCQLSRGIDIATGYFEISALLALRETWQSVDQIRILMGDEVSFRTKRAFQQGLTRIQSQLDGSLESEKERNELLEGVPAIVEAIRSGKIQCRVYRRDKFHAKAYITHSRSAVVGSFALVGSSNFTYPGLTSNVELNVKISGPEVQVLQDWYERHWERAEDITPDILQTIERHTQPRSPFEIWFKALNEYFRGRELEPDAWDQERSVIFPVLDKYQRDAYRNLMSIADDYGMAFLCDGVGLGKTYVGLMLIERLVFKEGKQVVLFAPKAAREDVWEPALHQHLGRVFSGFVNLVVYNHTDLQRHGKWPREIELTLRDADAVIIDEAHHFRNPGIAGEGVKAPSRYRQLQSYLRNGDGRPKQVFYLTATPVNNSVHDFRHMIELTSGGDERYFVPKLGIHSLRRHFIDLEKSILSQVSGNGQREILLENDIFEAEQFLQRDRVFEALVVQRSRAYIKESQRLHAGNTALFPERERPRVAPYSIKTTYGALLDSVRTAFQKDNPLFVLGIYYPLAYWKGDRESAAYKSFDEGRQKQVVMLVRTLFLKRFESSARDDKIETLIRLLKTDPALHQQKVIIFTEFADTARYLEQALTAAGIADVQRIDGGSSQRQRSDVIRRFSPYYNGQSSAGLAAQGKREILVLISTDVLSEGLNLQDATRLINYDLHWNPVRLMQRIGRVDRRLNPAVEARMLADHPELAGQHGQVIFWNFLPPGELDELLHLYRRVTSKVLMISRTLGIEGRTLLTPDDDFDPIKELNEQYDGALSDAEQLRLEYVRLVAAHPELAATLARLPLKVYSGRVAPRPGTRAVFFCYRIPRPDPALVETEGGEPRWSDAAGFTVWLCYDLEGRRTLSEPGPIANLIRAEPDTPRHCAIDRGLLAGLRKQAEKELTDEHLKRLQAPPGVTPVLKCWMELS